MNEIRNVHVLVEGQSEESFIRDVLAPYCAHRDVYMTQSVLTKKGSKGGDIRFSRSKKEIRNFLCQRKDLIVSTCAVTSSPVLPLPRVVARTNLPLSYVKQTVSPSN